MTALALLLTCLSPATKVTLESLIREMSDLRALTEVGNYKQAQSSSYDRASTNAAAGESWFANGDAGKFVRIEDRDGRKEFVLADLQGPGVVNRIWSANPGGRVRFYFDDAARPSISERLRDLLSGKAEPFTDPFSYGCASGWNLYFPIPYAKRLVITVDESNDEKVGGLYYHVGHRSYPAGTQIESYSRPAVDALRKPLEKVAAELNDPSLVVPKRAIGVQRTFGLKPQAEVEFFQQDGAGSVVELRVQYLGFQGQTAGADDNEKLEWTDPLRTHNVLRNTILTATFDGEKGVVAPLGDFFACAAGLTPFKSLPFEVTSDGTMVCRFVMPFAKQASLKLRYGGAGDPLFNTTVRFSTDKPSPNSLRFRAQYQGENSRTRPMKDMSFLNTKGKGRLVGIVMHVANPTTAWWGEGDEKIFVDGETFPSTFGTGTEDYFGYAWCDPTTFTRPYNGQPRADGPANKGQVSVYRWQIFDSIPYEKSIQFDLEMWHWADVTASFDRMAYWYSKPGDQGPVELDASALKLVEIPRPKPVVGAIEGENLKYSSSGGMIQRQAGFPDLSGGLQLWWIHSNPGDKLTLRFDVPETGRYEFSGFFCMNRDYGIHELFLNGASIGTIDFFADALKWETKALGSFDLSKGEAVLEAVSKGHRKEASGGNMFGLDYLLLKIAKS